MPVINVMRAGIVARLVNKMPDVMQERRADQCGIRTIRFGQSGALQRVLQLGHALAAVKDAATRLDEFEEFVDRVFFHDPPLRPSDDRRLHRGGQITAEFFCEIDRNAGVDPALPIEQLRMLV
jgi:hypothetical protein